MKDFKKNELIGNIHSIETFGAFDGPGVRYVIFFQGCPLKCKFCHNRDTWETGENKLMTVSDVLKDYDRYKAFYQTGGITASGGEAIFQLPFLIELFKEAKLHGIHTCLDTSAGTYLESKKGDFLELLKYTDLVLLDIKHIDNENHKWLVGIPNTNILKFAKLLSEENIPVVIRYILLPTINSSDEEVRGIRKFIDNLTNVTKVEVIPYHKQGIKKWEKMGLEYELTDIEEPTKELINHIEEILTKDFKFKE